jgi:hypothetical protein
MDTYFIFVSVSREEELREGIFETDELGVAIVAC